MRALDPEEKELWAKVTATIRPLSRDRIGSAPESLALTVDDRPKPPAPLERKSKGPPPRARPTTAPPRPRPGTTLDGSWDKRLTKGRYQKIKHAAQLLQRIEAAKVAQRCPRFTTFARWLDKTIASA